MGKRWDAGIKHSRCHKRGRVKSKFGAWIMFAAAPLHLRHDPLRLFRSA